MNTPRKCLTCILIVLIPAWTLAQKSALRSIRPEDLKRHMKFLASDELAGRSTGECGLKVAARYLAVQAGCRGGGS